MLRWIVAAGAAYFGWVFAAGFALGVLRVLLLVPRLGERWAELLEMPLMIVASYFAACWTVRRFALPADRIGLQLSIGLVALALLLGAELGVLLRLRGLTFSEYVASRDPVAGGAYVVALLVFALMPVLVGRRESSSTGERKGL